MFRFGGLVGGKAMPHAPDDFGNGETPDKISGVMIYIDRKPPTVTREGIELDGVDQTGVPYYGEPLRGGIRVYLDDKLAAIIKRAGARSESGDANARRRAALELRAFLKSHGVDTTSSSSKAG